MTNIAGNQPRKSPTTLDVNRTVVRLPGPRDSSLEDMREEQDEHAALRLAWLVFAGWWLSAIWLVIAWLFILLVVPRMAGLRMIANLPFIITLKPPADETYDIAMDTLARIEDSQCPQRRFIPRLLYCIAIGWWFSMGWAIVAWLMGFSVQKQPETMSMLMRLPEVMTLERY